MTSSRAPRILLGLERASTEAPLDLGLLFTGLARLDIDLFVMPALFSAVEKLPRGQARIRISEDTDSESLDMVIILSPHFFGLVQRGVVPIISELEKEQLGCEEFNALTEKGNAFIFAEKNEWDIVAATVRALENFKFPYDWQNIVKKCRRLGDKTKA